MSDSVRSLVRSDGSVLEYFVDDAAPEGAELLLYHPGTPAAGPIESPLLEAARSAGFVTVELVRPGYGGSTRQPGRSVADVVPLAVELADHLGHRRFATLGWSGGGPHALACAALVPERCAGALCLAGVAPYGEPDLDYLAGMGEDNIAEFGASLAGPPALQEYLTAAAEGLAGVTADEVVAELSSLLPDVDRVLLAGGAGEAMAICLRWSLSTGIWGWHDDDLAFVAPWGFDMSDVRRPVSLWQGSADLMVPLAHGQWLAAHLPEVSVHLIEGQGHLSIVEQIEPGLVELRRWLDS